MFFFTVKRTLSVNYLFHLVYTFFLFISLNIKYFRLIANNIYNITLLLFLRILAFWTMNSTVCRFNKNLLLSVFVIQFTAIPQWSFGFCFFSFRSFLLKKQTQSTSKYHRTIPFHRILNIEKYNLLLIFPSLHLILIHFLSSRSEIKAKSTTQKTQMRQ